MNKWLLSCSIFLLLLPIIYALDTSFNFIQSQDASIKIVCQLNGTYCPSNTNCHLTAYYPNSSILVNNQPMDYQTSYFNYTINGSNLDILGIYRGSAVCNYSDVLFNIGTFYFGIVKKDVTVNDTSNVSEGRIMTILSVLAAIFFFLWLIFYVKNKPIHYLFLFISIILVDSLIYFSYMIGDSTNSTYSGVLLKLFQVMLAITFILIIIMLIDITLKIKNYVEGVRKGKEQDMWGELPISNK